MRLNWNNIEIPDNPYFYDEDVVIYHGDCRDILPKLPKVDLVLTAPPYPNIVGGVKRNFSGGVSKRYTYEHTVGQNWDSGLDWLSIAWDKCTYALLVFSSYLSLVDIALQLGNAEIAGLITWYKRNSPPRGAYTPHLDTEFIWCFRKASGLNWHNLRTMMFDIPLPQGGCMAVERILNNDKTTAHPTQKPKALISNLLSIGGQTILDPFLGSGTTLRAAKDLGRKAIGIEIEEKYCEIAAKRMAQSVMRLE